MKFKIGDKVRCIKSDKEYSGAGWKLNREFIIDVLDKNDIAWEKGGGHGVYVHSLELVTENYEIF